MDGYGTSCDFDVNNDGATGPDDLVLCLTEAEASPTSTNPIYDFNCDGGVGPDDLAMCLDNAALVTLPGPSGHDCADPTSDGDPPCPDE